MMLLRPAGRGAMFRAVAEAIGGLSVLDICSGDGTLRKYIAKNPYQAIDRNPAFVAYLERHGVKAQLGNALEMSWPAADCLVLIEGLYHFLPDVDPLMKKVMEYPFRKFIISESVEHVAHSRWSWLTRFSHWATRVDHEHYPERFDEGRINAMFDRYGFQERFRIGSNMVGILSRP